MMHQTSTNTVEESASPLLGQHPTSFCQLDTWFPEPALVWQWLSPTLLALGGVLMRYASSVSFASLTRRHLLGIMRIFKTTTRQQKRKEQARDEVKTGVRAQQRSSGMQRRWQTGPGWYAWICKQHGLQVKLQTGLHHINCILCVML